MSAIVSESIMDEATFTRELNKYKVVRPSDYHKSRSVRTKPEVKTSRPQSTANVAAVPSGASSSGAGASSSGARSSTSHGDFLTLFSAATKGILTSAELERLLQAFAEEVSHVPEKISLYDLETFASQL